MQNQLLTAFVSVMAGKSTHTETTITVRGRGKIGA